MPPIKKTTVVRACMRHLNQWANESSDSTWRAALKYGAWRLGEEFKCPDIPVTGSQDGKSSSNSATAKTPTTDDQSSQTASPSKSGNSKGQRTRSRRKSTGTRGKKKGK